MPIAAAVSGNLNSNPPVPDVAGIQTAVLQHFKQIMLNFMLQLLLCL